MSAPVILILAMILDAIIGEPRWIWSRIPHPAVLMGRAVGFLDHRLNPPHGGIMAGIAALLFLMLSAAMVGWGLSWLGGAAQTVIVAILLAQRSLVQHVVAVADGLRVSLGDGRRAVSMIVSRDTAAMDQSAVARSAIESAAENLSDGIIAPAFWFLMAGLPGLMVYKIVNTADSMIGYRTPQYERFGKAAAYMDDAMNLVPARLTCLLIAIPARVIPALREVAKDAAQHRSPNAGWPEAAMARAIGVALAGPRAYDGKMQKFPWVGDAGARVIGPKEIDASVRMLWQAWGMMLGLTFLLALI